MAEAVSWEDQKKLIEINQRFSLLKEEIEEWVQLKNEFDDLKELSQMVQKDSTLAEEVEKTAAHFGKKLEQKEIQIFLSGKYDRNNAILSIVAGAGGRDAQDWAAILSRMYQRYCENKGFKSRILSQSFGEPGPEGRIGIKEASIEINGPRAYGWLKRERGVHRLVRISPFSAQDLRHTSFALVDILPQLPTLESEELEIKEEDLRVDTYRASGPGGQYVNKRESAVRITHLPTKISVSCQVERAQGLNRKKAMEMLKSKLLQIKRTEEKKEVAALKGKPVSVEWGNQIRSYVFYPYKMVKDHRTKIETADAQKVLDGELNQFIDAELRILASKD